ncbi:hypothetical protein ABBQ38_009469 [Trebouxia sp. C0009 RCD-2024]
MPWQREAEFKDALEKAVKKGSKGAIATAQNIALHDMGQVAASAEAARWSPSIAALVELVADLPASQMAQVEKVLASWQREKIFPQAIIEQCAVNAGVTLTQAVPSGLQSVPSGDAAAPIETMPFLANGGDGNEINIPSPAVSMFSEPSAGSVDLVALEESFPPKTVASANMEAPSKMATPTAIPASNASTGSSRPPDPPKPPPADLYDPFAAESYDYDPFGSEPAPVERPHMLPPLPSMAPNPLSNKPARAAVSAAALGPANTASDRQTSQVRELSNSAQVNGLEGKSVTAAAFHVLPPVSSQPALASRKRKSRWEDAAPGAPNHAADPASASLPDAAAPALPAAPAMPAEAPRPRRSRFSDAPPPAAAVHAASPQPGQGSIQPLPTETVSTLVVLPKPPQPSPKAEVVLPPKPASARQDGEAQAAAALQAVEQMLQAKRHSDARNIAPSTYRPKQPPLPAHQPPLPRPPPPQPPLPQMPPPQPAFTDAMDPGSSHAAAGPSWHAAHAGHAVHALPALSPRPPPPFLAQQPGFPHVPTMLQGFPPGIPRPHMGHFAPQQFVQAGLQQHHMPAPLHHLPSMLQTPPRPPPQGRPQPQSSAPQQYRPPPPASWPPPQQPAPPRQPRPLGQGSPALDRQANISKVDEQPGRSVTSAGARQLPSEADLGHFHSTSVAMDTPTDAGPGFPWKRAPQEGPPRTPGTVAGATAPPLHSHQDVDQTQASVQPAADQAVPGPPPSPPMAPPPPPPLLSMPGSSAAAPPAAAAPPSHDDPTLTSGDQAQSGAVLAMPPAAAAAAGSAAAVAATVPAGVLAGESRLPIPAPNAPAAALAAAPHASSEVTAAVDHPLSALSPDAAHAAAPAGPAHDSHDQHNGRLTDGLPDTASPIVTTHAVDEEMEMSD